MTHLFFKKTITLAGVFFAVWLFLHYLLPIFFPFILGALLAISAEPGVGILIRKLRLRRWMASGLGVSAAVILFLGSFLFLSSFFVRELGHLAARLPDLESAFRQGILALQDLLIRFANNLPEGIRPMAIQLILDLLSSGSALLSRLSAYLGGLFSSFLSALPGGFISIGTALISGYMISARLPRLKQFLRERTPQILVQKYLPMLRSLRASAFLWLKAQVKLSSVSLLVIAAGLLLLHIPHALLWAAVIALVDAVPILGSGTILLPWAFISLVRDDSRLALGLGLIYVAALVTRTVLEPRLIGKHLGLDPLVTLVALYAGFRLWGIGGMLLAPILAVVAMQLTASQKPGSQGLSQ